MPNARPSTRLGAAALAAAWLAFPSIARAQDAMAMFKQGRTLVEAGRWAEACPLFAEAHRLEPKALGILLNAADCYKQIGKTASSWAAYQEGAFLAKKNQDHDRAQYAEDQAASLEPRLSRLTIRVKDVPGMIVRRDDQEVGKGVWGTPFPVDPGPHKIEATAPGYSVWTTTLTIGPERDQQTVEVPALVKEAGPALPGGPWPALRAASFVAGGAGAAGLVVGAVFGGLSASATSALKKSCPNNVCVDPQDQASLSSAKTKALVADAALGAGGGLLAAGVVLFVVSRSYARRDDTPTAARIVPGLTLAPRGGGALSVAGAF
jgi:hypothetical protein